MPTPRVTIDQLPEQAAPEDANLLVVHDGDTTKKMTIATLKTIETAGLSAHIADPTGAHAATAISATDSGAGVNGADVQAQLGQLAGRADTANAGLAAHLADTVDAHDASAISAVPHTGVSATHVQGQLEELATALAVRDVMWVGVDAPADPAVEVWYDPDEPVGAGIEYATDAETIAGTLTNKGVTPAGFKAGQTEIDVRSYGAVGNGSADDTAALQAAVNAAQAASVPLRLGGGTYLITGTVTVTGSLTIIGNGPYRSRIRNNSLTADFFTATNAIFVSISGVEFDSTVVRTAGCLFNFNNVDHVRLDNLRIIDPFKAGDFIGCDFVSIDDVFVSHGTRVTNRGFFFQTCVNTMVNRLLSTMTDHVVANPQLTFDSGCDTVSVTNSVIVIQAGGSCEGIAFTHSLSPGSFAPRWVRINNVWVEGGSKDALRIYAALSLYVNNSYFVSSLRGAQITGGVDLRFNNCLFANNGQQGVQLLATNPIDLVSFQGCTFSDNSQLTTNTYDGIYVDGISGSASLTDCYFGDAILGRTAKHRYGCAFAVGGISLVNPKFGVNGTGTVGGPQLPYVHLDATFPPRLNLIDVNLWRAGANILRTDDKFWVGLDLEVDGALDHDGTTAGFYGATPVAKPTGVPVTIAGVHAALVSLGLIGA